MLRVWDIDMMGNKIMTTMIFQSQICLLEVFVVEVDSDLKDLKEKDLCLDLNLTKPMSTWSQTLESIISRIDSST